MRAVLLSRRRLHGRYLKLLAVSIQSLGLTPLVSDALIPDMPHKAQRTLSVEGSWGSANPLSA